MSDCSTDGAPTRLFYYRRSMTPTFTPGDMLTVTPYGDKKIRPGDVVVFPSPESGDLITHRVVEVTGEGIVTRGDNIQSQIDPWTLGPDDIVGCVVAAERAGKERSVWGGPVGIAYHRIQRRRARLDTARRRLLYAVIRTVDLGRWLSGMNASVLLPARLRPRVLAVRRPRGTELLLLMGSRAIGRHVPGGHLWSIRYLYLPFVNKAFLRKAVEEFGQR
ncbi:S26 family signal peptidase [Candidatus Fermentibacteria bacterium]|nr:S26 family signal peptidase [Candidatus Fermentibacteria bacterium]